LASQSGHGGGEKNHCPCHESNADFPVQSLVTVLTEVFHNI